jgi:Tfp pilus assembly protein PilO
MGLYWLKEFIRVWAPIIGLAFAGYYSYDYYYAFQQAPDSPLAVRKTDLTVIKKQNEVLEGKRTELESFSRQLEAKKEQVRAIAQQLAETRGALADDLQMPEFMKMLVSEAKRVGLTVLSITPARKSAKEYCYEYPVEVKFRGIYAQLYSYLSRISNLQRIVHVSRFDMKPISSSGGRFVELEGVLEVKTFSYIGSEADRVGKESK